MIDEHQSARAKAGASSTRMFLEDKRCDRVTAQLWLGIGSRGEGRRGIVHLVEHLLWADLTELAARDRALDGARIAAATGIDWMMFDVEAAAGAEAAVMKLLDHLWRAPQWHDRRIRHEVGVIRNESRMLRERKRTTASQIVGDDIDLAEDFTAAAVFETVQRVARTSYVLAVAGFRMPRPLGLVPRNWTVLDLAGRAHWDRLTPTPGVLPAHNSKPVTLENRGGGDVVVNLALGISGEADRTGRLDMLRAHLAHPVLGLAKAFPPFGPQIEQFSVAVLPLSQGEAHLQWAARPRAGIDADSAGAAFLDVAEQFGKGVPQAECDAIRALVTSGLERLAHAPHAFFRAFGEAAAFDGCFPAARFYGMAGVPDREGYGSALDALRQAALAAKQVR